jgi:flagellum-specific ATP synthase
MTAPNPEELPLSPKLGQLAALAQRYSNPSHSVTQGGHVRTIAAVTTP